MSSESGEGVKSSTSRVLSGRRYQAKGGHAQQRERRTCDGIVFDSILELQHYRNVLKPLCNARAIEQLRYHPEFTFELPDPGGGEILLGTYEADFSFIWAKTKVLEVQDVKAWEMNPRTGVRRFLTGPDYAWQKALMRACFGITVVEV